MKNKHDLIKCNSCDQIFDGKWNMEKYCHQSHEQNIHQDEDVYDDNAENNPPTTNLANVREDEAYLPVWSAQELLTLMMIEEE